MVLQLQIQIVQHITPPQGRHQPVAEAVTKRGADIGWPIKTEIGLVPLVNGREEAVRDLIVEIALGQRFRGGVIGRPDSAEQLQPSLGRHTRLPRRLGTDQSRQQHSQAQDANVHGQSLLPYCTCFT